MDYSNFLKSYYQYAMKRLKEFTFYCGSFAMLNYEPEIPLEYIRNEEVVNDFLPPYRVIINAPSNYIEQFLDYFAKTQLDLSDIYLGTEALRKLYSIMSNIPEEDQYDFIQTFINAAIEVAKRANILR